MATKGKKRDLTQVKYININQYKFERVSSFIYLGSLINDTNDINEEIKRRIQNANKAYFGLLRHFKSRLLTRKTKCNLYKTLVKPVLIYGRETWTLSNTNMSRLRSFETKILRKYMAQYVMERMENKVQL